VKVLESIPARKYTMLLYEDEDPETFQKQLIDTRGSVRGAPVKLSDGRAVGKVLSAATWPYPFTASDGEQYESAAVLEIQWDDAPFQKFAEEADITIEHGEVVLLGDDAGDRQSVKKSGQALLRDELHAAWRLP
jgi:hypothetical protein